MTNIYLKKDRPKSPHLQIYSWPITMATSIIHRATGIILSVGTVLLTIWLLSLAYSPAVFNWIDSLCNNIFIRILLFLYSYALILHGCGGVRHLFWDLNTNLLEKHTASKMAWLTIILATIINIIVWVIAYYIR